jgi:general secretion pathway protein E/type IV pilus assembly protein PilB
MIFDNTLSPSFCEKHHVLLISNSIEQVEIAVTSKTEEQSKLFLRSFFSDKQVHFRIIEEKDFSLRLSRLFSREETKTSNIPNEDELLLEKESVNIERIAANAPVINLLNSIILEAINRQASDIHIDSFVDGFFVRYRVSKLIEIGNAISKEEALSLSVRLKMLSRLNVLEKRRAQDGRFSIQVSSSPPVDVRLSIVPTVYGESIVMRLLHTEEKILSLDKLGFPEKELSLIKQLIQKENGLVLVTGPTGSGKTTTLNAMLSYLRTDEKKIISIEDPVEYRIPSITQIQTDEETGMTFSEILKRVLRQDPDIIMIGEIRDTQTANLAVRAALTGHLVLATLHTRYPDEAFIRLIDMGAAEYLVKAVLKGVIGQELMRDENKKLKLLSQTLIYEKGVICC